LHVQRYPELICYEGHVSEKYDKYAEGEVAVLPNVGIKEWMSVDILPDSKAEEEHDAEDEHH
jgi:hypothetical protein